jgi:hypothetical protein
MIKGLLKCFKIFLVLEETEGMRISIPDSMEQVVNKYFESGSLTALQRHFIGINGSLVFYNEPFQNFQLKTF